MEYTVGRFFKFIISIIIVAAVIWLLVQLSSTLTVLIISVLIAYILDPIASFLEYKGLSRTQATIILFIAIALVFTGLFYFLIPPLVNELSHIQDNLGSGSATETIGRVEQWIHQTFPFISTEDLDLQGKINTVVGHMTSSIFSIIGSLVSIVTTLIIIPFAVFFLLKDGRKMHKAIVGMIPNRYFEMSLNMIHKSDQQLGGYLRGQFFDALIIGILSTTALSVLNVPHALLIGIFAGLANMIPYVGPLMGAVTALIVVVLNNGSGQLILLVVAAFAVIQMLDNVVVQPLVVAKSVDLHPLIIIFVVIIGGQFFGILGMLLAVPATGTVKVLSVELYRAIRNYKMLA